MTADPAPSTETLTLELRTPTARRVLLGPPSKFMRGMEQRREWLAAIEAEARQQGAAEERARLLEWARRLPAVVFTAEDIESVLLASPPDAEPPAEEGTSNPGDDYMERWYAEHPDPTDT